MDKQATIGFILIGLILLVWMWINVPPPQKPHPPRTDTAFVPQQRSADSLEPSEKGKEQTPTVEDTLGVHFAHLSRGSEKVLLLETDLYRAEITTRGGVIRKWELKNYTTWDNQPVQLVDFERGGDFSILFTSSDGKLINTRTLYFDATYNNWERIRLRGKEEYTLELVLKVSGSSQIVKSLRFTGDRYSFDATVRFENMQAIVSNFEYQLVWENGLRLTEVNSQDEASFAAAYAHIGGELVDLDAASDKPPPALNPSGSTDWVAARTKYFAVAIISADKKASGAYLAGSRHPLPDRGVLERYSIGLKEPFKGSSREVSTSTVFIGPLDFYLVKSYGVDLERIMDFGWEWIIRPIAVYFMLPVFRFLHGFIPNYGLVIIVFTILIRILLHPLTHASMKSMKKMQALQPMMLELREKYKEDPQRMNREIMKLYKEYGVNPASGCLLLLPQMPILYALYMVFRAAIELRQAEFVLWIKDLSSPDTILRLPFAIPILGTSDISGLALFMGVTMFVQQKMMVKDPRQKMMIWFLPILMTLLFNLFPSGLNLYYSVFNVLAIAQQFWITKHGKGQPVLRKVDETKKRKPRGVFNRITVPKLKR